MPGRRWWWAAAGALVIGLTSPARGADPPAAVEVPFELGRHLLLVPATLAGQTTPGLYIVDTGAGITMLHEPAVAALGLAVKAELPAVDTTGRSSKVKVVQLAQIQVGGYTATEVEAALTDLSGLSLLIGRPLTGILGHNLLSRQALTVDYAAGRVTFGGAPEPTAETLVLPAVAAKPFTPIGLLCRVDDQEVQASLDTGAADCSLPRTFLEQLPADRHPRREARGGMSGGLFGMSDKDLLVRCRELRIGDLELRHYPVSSVVSQRGLLGYGLLCNYHLVVDYPHQRVLLRRLPGRSIKQDLDTFGVAILKLGGLPARVTGLWPGAAAAQAGLALADVVESINGQPASGLTQAELAKLLFRPEVRELTLDIRRDNTPQTVKLTRGPVFGPP
ncbi:MAG: aspartyl protease family protein [Fimbriimonadaceae bacterium]|nr:aspartyl protease family protein [Fimbriimonadaceae bacterium]